MKGTFFSADFVRDINDDLRLIEINTDTGIVESQQSVFDWSDFITILDTNNITKVDVVYKHSVQFPIVNSLSASLAENATFITEFNKVLIADDSIFPTSPEDAEDKFVLRMAYDELAILDSEYAKGTLGLLKLYVDANDTTSTINFYHSSSVYGEYNTIDTDLGNSLNLPDVLTKTVVEQHSPHTFYKIGHSNSESVDRLNTFLNEKADSDTIIQQYHYSPSALDETNKVSSIRTFQIVYGSDLDLCYVAEYEIDAILNVPVSIEEYDDSILSNTIEPKHYYEFATNHIKNLRHGFIGDTKLVDINDNLVEIHDVEVGNQYKSYFIEGAPNTDSDEEIRNWFHSGSTLPEGSYLTSSILVGIASEDTYTTELTKITFADNSHLFVGGETRMLIWDDDIDAIQYQRVLDLDEGDAILKSNGGTVNISSIDTVIFDEKQTIYTLNLEDVDNFILEVNNIHGFSLGIYFVVAHNCFVAGTQISMADGSVKNIEDIVDGDVVLSLNENGLNVEPKTISNVRVFDETNFITIKLENGKEIVSTLDHPYYTTGPKLKSYNGTTTNGEKLEVGDSLFLLNSKEGEMSKIESIIEHTDSKPVYIFTVDGNHNFYANEILVHNK
jgi:hypothetical protein